MRSEALNSLISDLPEDRELALIQIYGKFKSRYVNGNHHLGDHDCMVIANFLQRYIHRYEINAQFLEKEQGESWREHLQHLETVLREFERDFLEREAERDLDELFIELDGVATRALDFGETKLSSEDKSQIHDYLSKIREKIDTSKIPEAKKNSILKHINLLALEVDRYGTRIDGFAGLVVELSIIAKKFHENLKPAIDDAQKALETIYVRRTKNEKIELPKPDEMPQLPKPETHDV